MAGLADVEKALVGAVATAIGLPGNYLSGALGTASGIGIQARVMRGWPIANTLDADMLAGAGQVTIYPGAGMARNTTRYLAGVSETVGTATITATVAGLDVTFGGTAAVGHVVGVAVGIGAAPAEYAYRVEDGDTLTVIATEMAALIPSASSAGPVLTVPAPSIARVAVDGSTRTELRRTQQAFRIAVWMPTPDARDAAADALDAALAGLPFICTAAGEAVRITYAGTQVFDPLQKERIWRRDIQIIAEYPTTLTDAVPAVLFADAEIVTNDSSDAVVAQVITAPLAATVGAIRWDAWYSVDDLNSAVAADLSPAQFRYRLPFFATVAAGVATIDGNHQAIMDAEIAAAAAGGLDYWAFLAGNNYGNALALYLASADRADIDFCMISHFSNIYFTGLGYSAELAATIALTAQSGYAKVLDGRPLFYMFDSGDADILYRFGSFLQLQKAVAYIRAEIYAATSRDPYMVVLSGDPARAARLMRDNGFDAASAYAVSGSISTPTPYAALAVEAEAWRDNAIGHGAFVVPPIMTGWNYTPRIITPHPLFGAQVSGDPNAYYLDGTPAEIAAHVAETLVWLGANRNRAPAQTALCYAWNEFDEGGWLCPTYLAGNPAGDSSRLTALAAVLA